MEVGKQFQQALMEEGTKKEMLRKVAQIEFEEAEGQYLISPLPFGLEECLSIKRTEEHLWRPLGALQKLKCSSHFLESKIWQLLYSYLQTVMFSNIIYFMHIFLEHYTLMNIPQNV